MYATETFHSRPALAKYAKMSLSSQKLWIKKSIAVIWYQRIPHSLAEKYTCDSS